MGRHPTWSDEQLRAAVAASTSFKEVVLRLRAEAGGASHRAVRSRVAFLGLDTSHFGQLGRDDEGRLFWSDSRDEGPATRSHHASGRTWTDEDLRDAVRKADTLYGVFKELGLVVGGAQWIVVRQTIKELELDTTHWKRPLGLERGGRSWTDDELRAAVPDSRSYAEVLRRLGLRPGGGTHDKVKSRIKELGLDATHFLGQGWLRGRIDPRPRRYRKSLEQILVRDSTYLDNTRLKQQLIAQGIKAWACETCGIEDWMDKPIVLHLDHINGDRRDNRLENLRLVCPNCHSQTETYCGRNVGRYGSEEHGLYLAA